MSLPERKNTAPPFENTASTGAASVFAPSPNTPAAKGNGAQKAAPPSFKSLPVLPIIRL